MRQSHFFCLLLLFSLSACSYEKKTCEYQTDNSHLRVYNDVLLELTENRFRQLYLGQEGEKILAEYKEDSARLHNQLAKAQNKRFQNPETWCTLLLDTAFNKEQSALWVVLGPPVLNLIADSLEMGDPQPYGSVLDSLRQPQNKFQAQDFQTCTFQLSSITSQNQPNKECQIGRVQFSKLILNPEQTKGWLYYEFNCGQNCGKGEILLVEKEQNRWRIKKDIQLWEL